MHKGAHHTKETKKKMSESHEGKYVGKDNPMFGKHHSAEAKRKMSESTKGKKHPFFGKHHTEETLKKLSKAKKGKNHPLFGKHLPLETREKLSKANKGKIRSPETLIKMAEASRGRIASKESREKMSKAHRGEKNHNWLGGVSFEPYGIEFNKQLKELIKRRDRYRCQECFIHQDMIRTRKGNVGYLIPHHIDYNKQNNAPNNLISLCGRCHSKTNCNREHWTKYFNEVALIRI